jgi:hypothetical protein
MISEKQRPTSIDSMESSAPPPVVDTEDPLQVSDLTGAIRGASTSLASLAPQTSILGVPPSSTTVDETTTAAAGSPAKRTRYTFDELRNDIKSVRTILKLVHSGLERMSEATLEDVLLPTATISATVFGTYFASRLVYDFFSTYIHQERLRIENDALKERLFIEADHKMRMNCIEADHMSRMIGLRRENLMMLKNHDEPISFENNNQISSAMKIIDLS